MKYVIPFVLSMMFVSNSQAQLFGKLKDRLKSVQNKIEKEVGKEIGKGFGTNETEERKEPKKKNKIFGAFSKKDKKKVIRPDGTFTLIPSNGNTMNISDFESCKIRRNGNTLYIDARWNTFDWNSAGEMGDVYIADGFQIRLTNADFGNQNTLDEFPRGTYNIVDTDIKNSTSKTSQVAISYWLDNKTLKNFYLKDGTVVLNKINEDEIEFSIQGKTVHKATFKATLPSKSVRASASIKKVDASTAEIRPEQWVKTQYGIKTTDGVYQFDTKVVVEKQAEAGMSSTVSLLLNKNETYFAVEKMIGFTGGMGQNVTTIYEDKEMITLMEMNGMKMKAMGDTSQENDQIAKEINELEKNISINHTLKKTTTTKVINGHRATLFTMEDDKGTKVEFWVANAIKTVNPFLADKTTFEGLLLEIKIVEKVYSSFENTVIKTFEIDESYRKTIDTSAYGAMGAQQGVAPNMMQLFQGN